MGIFDFLKKRDLPNREEIIANVFFQLDQNLKSAAIATIGGSRPTGDVFKSRFSGSFVMGKDEDWPVYNGKPMQALLQINVKELPFVPVPLRDYAFITVFCVEDEYFFHRKEGNGWIIRTYANNVDLEVRTNPISNSGIKSFEIQWDLSANEGPNWEDAWTVVNLNEFNELNDSGDLFYDRYNNNERTKVGGWPALIQSELEMKAENFVFQIGSEPKANFNIGDGGTIYIGLIDGEWVGESQCY